MTRIDSYSHGMQQKASLAAALMHDPKVLVLDEPTVGLDPKSARLIKDILRQMADRGAAVFLSTHILEIAERMCDRIGIINKGELVAVGTMDELRALGKAGGEPAWRISSWADRRRRGSRDRRGAEMSMATLPASAFERPAGRIWKLAAPAAAHQLQRLPQRQARRKIASSSSATVVCWPCGRRCASGSWFLLGFLRSPELAELRRHWMCCPSWRPCRS